MLQGNFVIEKLEQNVFVRSRHCNFGVDGVKKICDAPSNGQTDVQADMSLEMVI